MALRDRLRRLMVVPWATASHEVSLVVRWIDNQVPLRAVLVEAAGEEPGLEIETFLARFTRGGFSWPSRTEGGRATLIWKLMQHIAAADATDDPRQTIFGLIYAYGGNSQAQDNWREFAESVLQPLFDVLSERVGEESSVLYVLDRYVRRVEWFDREDLYERFSSDTRNGEEVYNVDLQRFLFLEGNYTTYAKPRSASGEADIVTDLDTEDPLVCDGKIFDGNGRGKSYIAKGVHQVIRYAQDYYKSAAFLVVFNITEKLLQFPSDADAGVWPPYVELSGVRVYFVGVRVLPPATTASKAGRATQVTITKDDLLNPDATT